MSACQVFCVLAIDDYEPFRRFVCSTLGTRPELQIVGEAPDGLEAVHKAEELQPDLILLDLGLPTLNGIEAARRIRQVSPTSRILFVSENHSVDVAEEALNTGWSQSLLINCQGTTNEWLGSGVVPLVLGLRPRIVVPWQLMRRLWDQNIAEPSRCSVVPWRLTRRPWDQAIRASQKT